MLKIQKITIIFLLVIYTFTSLVIVDKILGKFHLINYQKNTREAIYRTPEFTIKIRTNSQGFRDREHNEKKPDNTIRILTIGDSFTFGWGVNIEDSWSFIVEKELNKISKNYEVINVSQPGNTPFDYAKLAKKYVPFYKPDFILVGFVEGNDFTQLIINTKKQNNILTEYGEFKKRQYIS